jgi:hypothetical protein
MTPHRRNRGGLCDSPSGVETPFVILTAVLETAATAAVQAFLHTACMRQRCKHCG